MGGEFIGANLEKAWMEGIMSITKEIGKIQEVTFGCGGYGDGMIGFNFTFGSDKNNWGTARFYGAWGIKRSEYCKWTEESRLLKLGESVMLLNETLQKAKKSYLHELVGTPVECTFENMTLTDWRVLEEVI